MAILINHTIRYRPKRIILVFFSVFLFGNLIAGNPEFTASLSKSTVAVGERFKVTYTINANASNFRPPSLSNFNVLSGPNQSSSMQWINGNFSQSISFSYVLTPQKPGDRKSTRLNSSHIPLSRMPSSA